MRGCRAYVACEKRQPSPRSQRPFWKSKHAPAPDPESLCSPAPCANRHWLPKWQFPLEKNLHCCRPSAPACFLCKSLWAGLRLLSVNWETLHASCFFTSSPFARAFRIPARSSKVTKPYLRPSFKMSLIHCTGPNCDITSITASFVVSVAILSTKTVRSASSGPTRRCDRAADRAASRPPFCPHSPERLLLSSNPLP